jgi:branched-subunit amino acid transport protein AzlD
MILVILRFFPFYYFHSLKTPMNVTMSDEAIKAAATTMNLAL